MNEKQVPHGNSLQREQFENSPSKAAAIDLKGALARLGGDAELLKQLAVMYLEDVPTLIQELHLALERTDHEEVARIAHSISGLSSTFGAAKCCAISRAIEAAGRRDDLMAAGSQTAGLQSEFEHVREALLAIE